jgi:hypothetical protein
MGLSDWLDVEGKGKGAEMNLTFWDTTQIQNHS